jgi:peptidyl-prolyl cis-trans isomerase A (cyclophilin A)
MVLNFTSHIPTELDNKTYCFGHVVEGQDIVDAVEQGDVLESLKLLE